MTQTLKLPQTVRSAKRVTGAVEEYIRYSSCTLEQAQRRVGKAELSGKTITKNGVQYTFR